MKHQGFTKSAQNCSVCGGKMLPWLRMPLDAKKFEPTPHADVDRCTVCGLGAVRNLPAPAEVPAFYQLASYYTHGESHMQEVKPTIADRVLGKIAWKRQRETPFVPEDVAKLLPAGGSVIDLGCGHSPYLGRFRDMGFDVVGVDPDEEARAYAKQRGINVLPGTGEDIPTELEGRKFDLVIMTHSLEHCIHPFAAVRNAFALLKDGGYFYCEVPNCGSDHFREFTVSAENFDLPRHLYFFDRGSLDTILRQGGFMPTRWFWRGYARHHSASWRAWELKIADNLRQFDPSVPVKRHTFWRSALVLARSYFAPESRKYDVVGTLALKEPER